MILYNLKGEKLIKLLQFCNVQKIKLKKNTNGCEKNLRKKKKTRIKKEEEKNTQKNKSE